MGEVEKVSKLFCGSIKIVHDKLNLILIFVYINFFFSLKRPVQFIQLTLVNNLFFKQREYNFENKGCNISHSL